MTIDPKRFQKRHHGKKGGGPVMVNIRLRKVGGKPTAGEVRRVIQHILDTGGEVPDGWQFAGIDWRNPRRSTSEFVSGTIDDFDAFRAVLLESLHSAGISIVRKEGPT